MTKSCLYIKADLLVREFLNKGVFQFYLTNNIFILHFN